MFAASAEGKKPGTKAVICSFLLSNILFLGIPADMWSQTNGWVAGFSNFVLSALGMLVYFHLIFRPVTGYKSAVRRVTAAALHFIFGAVIQLFIENLAVLFLMFSLGVVIYRIFKKERSVNTFMLLGGNIAGAILMFSNNIYSSLWNTGSAVDGYRVLQYDRSQPFTVFLSEAAQRYLVEYIPLIVSLHVLLPVCISLLLFLIGIKKIKTMNNTVRRAVTAAMLLFNALYFIYYLLILFNKVPSFIEDAFRLEELLDAGFSLVVSIETPVMFIDEKKLLPKLLTAWFVPFAVMVPMLAVDSIGYRCFYTGAISLCLFCQMLLFYYLGTKKFVFKTVCLAVLGVLAAFFAVSMIRIYSGIGHVSRVRSAVIASVRSETGSVTIELPSYPFEQYLWYPDPADDTRVEYFKEFYKIPDNVEVEFN